MHLMRRIFSCLVIAIIFAMSVNGVAMAANGLGHQLHCLDAFGETLHDAISEHAHEHKHELGDLAAQHATPGHDHETCMIHACPALSGDAITLGELTEFFTAKLSWPELPQHVLERADGMKRPPKS